MTIDFIKTREAENLGNYTPTTVDSQKAQAQIRLLQVGPKVVDSKIELKGRGIQPMTVAGRYIVSDKVWEKIQATYSWATDF